MAITTRLCETSACEDIYHLPYPWCMAAAWGLGHCLFTHKRTNESGIDNKERPKWYESRGSDE